MPIQRCLSKKKKLLISTTRDKTRSEFRVPSEKIETTGNISSARTVKNVHALSLDHLPCAAKARSQSMIRVIDTPIQTHRKMLTSQQLPQHSKPKSDRIPTKAIRQNGSSKKSRLRAEIVKGLLLIAEETINLLPKTARAKFQQSTKHSTLENQIAKFSSEIKNECLKRNEQRCQSNF